MNRILIIHTGGTFGMVPSQPDEILIPGNLQNQLLKFLPDIKQIADIEVTIPFNMDSSNIGHREWDKLGELIHENINGYTGFVIIHGTDTMVYTAAALSFTLRNLKKPVVITGAQRPLSQLRSDARINLIDAIELATMGIPEVLIVFGQKVLRGNRTKKISTSNYAAFDSPNYPLIGEIGVKIQLHKKNIFISKNEYFLSKGFNPKVAVLSVYPSLEAESYLPMLNMDISVFILRGFGAGHLPNTSSKWLNFIKTASDRNKLVFISSHSKHGSVDLDLYDAGKLAKDSGAIGLADMTIESAYVKLQKILANCDNRNEIKDQVFQNWAGEI